MFYIETIKQLLTDGDDHTLSLYLNVNPGYQENQARTPAWRIALKNALRDIEAKLTNDQKTRWANIEQRVSSFFADYPVTSKGLALFVGETSLWEFPLPLPVENQAYFGRPFVMPLLWAIDEYEHYLVLMVDKEKAHFLIAYLGSAVQEDTLTLALDTSDWREKTLMPATSYGRGLNQGQHVDQFEDRVDEQIERFYRQVVQRAQELSQSHPFDRIILAGSEQSAHAVQRLMPDALAQRVIGVLAVPMHLPPHEVLAQVLPSALEYERQEESRLVEQVIDLAKSGGRGALGRQPVLSALAEGRVELLLVPHRLTDDDLKTDLTTRILEAGGKLEIVHGDAAARLQEEGELAARLYYSV